MPTAPADRRPPETTRGPGRPRTRPKGVKECPVYLTPAEIRTADRIASRDGLSRAEWMRRLITAALVS